MAKKSEDGIEYFPMNSDIIHNPKIKLVVAEFGSRTTWAVLLPLYCKIYRDKGYWIDWYDEDSKLIFAQDECKVELSMMNELVNGCIRRSLFNKGVFEMFGILTSDRIQENYLIAKKRNKSAKFIEEFKLLSDDVYNSFTNVYIIALNADIITKKVDIRPQKKKEKEIIEGELDNAEMRTQIEIDSFTGFQNWIKKHAPRVNKLTKPFTINQFLELKKEFRSELIIKILTAMENRGDLLRKYTSAYLTARDWLRRETSTFITDKKPSIGQQISEEKSRAILNS